MGLNGEQWSAYNYVGAARAGRCRRDRPAVLIRPPFIRYNRRSFGGRRVDQFLRDQRIAVQEAIELDELQAMVQLVARGQGVALVPRTLTQGVWPAGVRAVPLGDDTFYREIGLVERPLHSRQAIAGRLADCIDAAARQGEGV
ncbi:LysR substrate-binding domain-containing protein [Ralstonia solanacearum species complex bacterium KE056]|uniref:LysR substrate-binding domain-containing protein n=1 Tax=Ralstonia solanacearum species complex bacterium KE056 TaxID=3119585 RepID=UPI002FC3B219